MLVFKRNDFRKVAFKRRPRGGEGSSRRLPPATPWKEAGSSRGGPGRAACGQEGEESGEEEEEKTKGLRPSTSFRSSCRGGVRRATRLRQVLEGWGGSSSRPHGSGAVGKGGGGTLTAPPTCQAAPSPELPRLQASPHCAAIAAISPSPPPAPPPPLNCQVPPFTWGRLGQASSPPLAYAKGAPP